MGEPYIDLNLDIGPPGPQGYACWDAGKCKLCSCFRDKRMVLRLFLDHFVILGKTIDLLHWSQEGDRCMLCVYIILQFIEELGGPENFISDADFIVRWNFRKQGSIKRSMLYSFEFEMSWGFPQMRVKKVIMSTFTVDEEPASSCIDCRPPNGIVSSPAAFATAREWIEDCDSNHPACASDGPTCLPTRVLEISGGNNINDITVRLRETNNEEGKYVALSYVWGDPKKQCLTVQENYAMHLDTISMDELPYTLVDAVICTHQLGLKYLWIDALCIIQDSLEDKAHEVANMAKIYKNSYVTISAATASSASEGFTNPREMLLGIRGTCFNISMALPEDTGGLLAWLDEHEKKGNSATSEHQERSFLFEKTPWYMDDAPWTDAGSVWLAGKPANQDSLDLITAPKLEDEPISKRGWTLQESWLSRRMLIYGSGQTVWRCQKGSKADGGRAYSERDLGSHDLKKPLDADSNVRFRSLWRNLLGDFSHRELGVPADKLSAMQGIAQDLEEATGDEYLAGLWRGDMVDGLSWYQDMTHRGHEKVLFNKDRTCPSWSWAKVDGPITFSMAENVSAVVESASVTRNQITGDDAWASRLVVEGQVTIRAPISTLPAHELLPNFRWPRPDTVHRSFTNNMHLDGGMSIPEFQIGDINGQPTISCPDGLKFLELSRGKWGGPQNLAAESRGLVIVPVEGKEGTYRRAGFFVVALEYDVEMVASGMNPVLYLSVEPRDVRPTEFGELWTRSLEEGTITLV